MSNILPNPWEFSNEDKNLDSASGKFRIEFSELNEIAMGGPLGGLCYVLANNNPPVLLNEWCGGPAQWETTTNKIALPLWISKPDAIIQQLAVADMDARVLTVYSKIFRVLDLHKFDKNSITGLDSPIHNTSVLKFDISKEKIENIIQLK